MTEPTGGPRRTATVSVLFCDLVGSTERQVRLGDDASDEFRRRFFAALGDAVARSGGEQIKNTGDGLMVVFRHSAADAVMCANAMHDAVDALDPDDPDDPARLYVGISAGEAASVDGDWFGTPVNEAARLCAAAKPGCTLTNETVRNLVGSRGSFSFRAAGQLALKGLPTPVSAVEVVRGDSPMAPTKQSRSRKPWLVAGAAVALVAIVAGAIAVVTRDHGNTAAAQATGTTLPHNYPVSFVSAKCPAESARQIAGLTCGVLTVPEDRSKPHGRVVKLGVFRAPARGKATSDPVVDFGADHLATSPARDHSDEIQLGMRGWGGAPMGVPALTCPEYAPAITASLVLRSDDARAQRRESDALAHCRARWDAKGIDLNRYTYLDNGRDMVDLIRALHLSQVNLISGYVETLGALEVIRQLPGVVRTLTLQEPVAPGKSSSTDPTKYLADAFNNYIQQCQADAGCKRAFPDLAALARRDFEWYKTAHPVVVGTDNDDNQHNVLIDPARAAIALQTALNHRDSYPLIAAALGEKPPSALLDTTIANQVVNAGWRYVLDPHFAIGALLSGSCSYDLHTVDTTGSAISRKAVPEFSGVDDGFLARACKSWPVREIDDSAYDDPSTAVPTLIVTPTMVPGADPGWSDIFRRGLPNATVLTFPTLDGDVLGASDPACLATLRRQFLADPAQPLDAVNCEKQSPKIRFVTSLGG